MTRRQLTERHRRKRPREFRRRSNRERFLFHVAARATRRDAARHRRPLAAHRAWRDGAKWLPSADRSLREHFRELNPGSRDIARLLRETRAACRLWRAIPPKDERVRGAEWIRRWTCAAIRAAVAGE